MFWVIIRWHIELAATVTITSNIEDENSCVVLYKMNGSIFLKIFARNRISRPIPLLIQCVPVKETAFLSFQAHKAVSMTGT